MVVQTNIASMNANRMLGITSGKQSKSAEKLGSGYKINRASDDEAGLAISEKMRKQINGLDRASTNAQDGISAAQTAEGALGEVQSMLQRMNELAVQAANGTNSEEDRDAIQAEMEQLSNEIDRVTEYTRFNETVLLNGGEGAPISKALGAYDAGLPGELVGPNNGKYTFTPATLNEGDKIMIGGVEYEIVGTDLGNVAENKLEIMQNQNPLADPNVYYRMQQELVAANSVGVASGVHVEPIANRNPFRFEITPATVDVAPPTTIALHVGATAQMSEKIVMSIEELSSRGLGVRGVDVSDATGKAATYAIDVIGHAIQSVSTQRAALGAIQNRLEHTIANLDNVSENTSAADSRIRDTDMATEMVEYSKNNILMQAGQSMLAQANQVPQGVLNLLR